MLSFIKREAAFSIAFILTVVSAFFVHPSAAYIDAIDWRVLGLLFCLMGISIGLRKSGFFHYLAIKMLEKAGSFRTISMLFVSMVFFVSMLITNDVSLIVFVPFTLMLLDQKVKEEKIVTVIVLETLAANLGSMATPVGNPQNLYIYSYYSLSPEAFFSVIIPPAVLSLVLLLAITAASCSGRLDIEHADNDRQMPDPKLTTAYFALLLLALLTVFKIIDWRILLVIEALFLALFARDTYREIDYILLLTFICFFIFSGNIGQIGAVKDFLVRLLDADTYMTGALTSQVISNVPAAILLSSFTGNWKELLLGVDIGGLGTPIASLASLISLKFYMARKGALSGRYIAVFSVLNFALLAVISAFCIAFML